MKVQNKLKYLCEVSKFRKLQLLNMLLLEVQQKLEAFLRC